jgi:hypothetical protein
MNGLATELHHAPDDAIANAAHERMRERQGTFRQQSATVHKLLLDARRLHD